VFWLPKRGEMQAALVFRVGRRDESLISGGLSHLVEHLALNAVQRSHPINGFVDVNRTVFWCSGDQGEVTSFLNNVSTTLQELPLGRLDDERRVLTVEASARSGSPVLSLLTYRFGPVGAGLLGYEELGLRVATADDVAQWARTKFVARNAALWVWGEPSDALDLHLAAGEPAVLSPQSQPPLPTPSLIRGRANVVALGMLVPRSRAATTVGRIAATRLQDRLRGELAATYTVAADYLPIDSERAHLTFATDVVPETAQQVAHELLAALDDLAANGPMEHELRDQADLLLRSYAGDGADARWLDAYAMAHLLGEPEPSTPSAAVKELDAVTPEQLAETLEGALASAVVSLPSGLDAPKWRFQGTDQWSTIRVEGETFDPAPGNGDHQLIVGTAGVTVVVEAPNKVVTVRTDECEALQQWDDGTRVLHGRDGFILRLRPWGWRDGETAIRATDELIPDRLKVPMGPGAGPTTTPPVAATRSASRWRRATGTRRGRVLIGALAVLLTLIALSLIFTEASPDLDAAPGVPLSAVPVRDGSMDCGLRTALRTVVDGADPRADPQYRSAIGNACRSDALWGVGLGAGILVVELGGGCALLLAAIRTRRSSRPAQAPGA